MPSNILRKRPNGLSREELKLKTVATMRLNLANERTLTPEEIRLKTVDPSTSTLAWAQVRRRIHGQLFTLERFPMLEQIYLDEWPRIVVMKAAQRGASEWAINRAFFVMEFGVQHWHITGMRGLNVAYLFPKKTQLEDFSKERLTPMNHETPGLEALFHQDSRDQGANSLNFKRIGQQSHLYMRGMQNEDSIRSYRADLLVKDEVDRMEETMLAKAGSRKAASDLNHDIALSTPSIPEWGIDKLYRRSCQFEWHVPCQRGAGCGWKGAHDFHRDVRADGEPWDVWRWWVEDRLLLAEYAVHCPNCGEPTEHWATIAEGAEWVALRPDLGAVHGFYIPWYGVSFVKLADMAVMAANPNPSVQTAFYNDGLGLPYEATGSRVTPAMLERVSDGAQPLTEYAWHVLGVDVGNQLHYCVLGISPGKVARQAGKAVRLPDDVAVLAMGAVMSFDEIDRVWDQWHIRAGVIDAMPDIHAAKTWANKHVGRVLRARFGSDDTLLREWYAIEEKAGERTGVVVLNRTTGLDLTLTAIEAEQEWWSPSLAREASIVEQMGAQSRHQKRDKETGEVVTRWLQTRPLDHYRFAHLYAHAARATLPRAALPSAPLAQGATGGWNPATVL